ncbi:hypothetical protein OCS_01885 [Ophiocordyceps sinensis CO18]|uniref:Uncharacterized protein n=1 Tax=Ophiocordyceps sinensis (strain Co18 / CGMCC 3.14243) TaxID=911162 RepID=T5AKQ5_OPHSC|nr:hypothetical protein OCS_01885 [Ophiocordyceps sinensis CO18]
MANIICRYKWGRVFDSTQDRLQSSGQYAYDGNRCFFLVDNGPPESQDVSLSMYKWDGKQFIKLPLGPQVTNRLRHHPFNASPRVGYTDDEFKEKYGEDAYKKLVLGRIEQRRRWGQKLPKNETEFLKRYPELDTEA